MFRLSLAFTLTMCCACKQEQPTTTATETATQTATQTATETATPPSEPTKADETVKADAAYCEGSWLKSPSFSAASTRSCTAHWLRYAYGDGYGEEALSLDPGFAGPISTRFTAEEFLAMQALVRKIAKTPCDDVEKEPVVCRAIAYFSLEADSHFNLTDPWRLEPITPLLGRIIAGEALSQDQLEASDAMPSWSAVTLWRLRNAVFARHGRPFQNPDLKRFFYGDGAAGLAKDVLPLRQAPDYSDKMLSEVDRNNIDLIKRAEAALKNP